MPQIIVNGADVAKDPNINSNSSGGYQGQGQVTVSAQSVFQADDVIVFEINNVSPKGEINPWSNSGLTDITVYDSYDDYLGGTVKYHYAPQNPGQSANVQSDVSGLGDGYVRFVSANVMIPQNGGPSFNQLFVAPNSGIGTSGFGSFSTKQQFDLNSDGDFEDDLENGNTYFYVGDYVAPSPICFVSGTKIKTIDGEISVEDLEIGQRVLTLDNGYQPLRWIGSTRRSAVGKCAPVLIKSGALANDRDLLVSQQHRMLITGWQAELLFGTTDVLVPAKSLINDCSVRQKNGGTVEYFHIMFDRHQIVFSNGAPSESLHLGSTAIEFLDDEVREELELLFPAQIGRVAARSTQIARMSVKAREALPLKNLLF